MLQNFRLFKSNNNKNITEIIKEYVKEIKVFLSIPYSIKRYYHRITRCPKGRLKKNGNGLSSPFKCKRTRYNNVRWIYLQSGSLLNRQMLVELNTLRLREKCDVGKQTTSYNFESNSLISDLPLQQMFIIQEFRK